jgi:hypothetical protein
MRAGANIVSASDASEGALYVLFMLALLFHPRTPGFFAIEHFDHALHPRLARALIAKLGEHVRASSRQILLTTHNPLVLDRLALADDDIRLFTADRTETGQTVIRRVEYTDALAKATASDAPLSQMWTSGLLGAVRSWAHGPLGWTTVGQRHRHRRVCAAWASEEGGTLGTPLPRQICLQG